LEDWDDERREIAGKSENFSEECFLFATKVMYDIRKRYNEGMNVPNTQIKLLNLILSKIETIIESDLKIKTAKQQTESGQEIPAEVAADPEVAEMLEKIAVKIEDYKRKENVCK
jgi:hypothetical protein